MWLPAVSSVEQSLQEVWTVDELLGKLRAVIRDFRGFLNAGRVVAGSLRLVLAGVRARPHAITSAHEAWIVAEAIEPHFSDVFVQLSGPTPESSVHEASLASLLGDELMSRLSYLQTLTGELHERLGQPRPRRSYRAHRESGQALIEDLTIPPEIRLVVHQSRLVPILIFLIGYLDHARRRGADDSGRVRELYLEALREGLDSKISFLLALLQPSPPQPPPALDRRLPDPMPLEALDARWRNVRASFG
ncbi:hypothetical protein DB30_04185 [Enhygromyxa salina]|uniref:Uncharacterized protein n=1 Tax=Enhygromyxa salina TaxID=215803 RepID=A0A0C2D9X8_9BACT|nr:hypothetical protein DB30_04185 [Enhygromyxa salina]